MSWVSGVVELTALIGYYVMVAMMLHAYMFGVPDGVVLLLPPRGR